MKEKYQDLKFDMDSQFVKDMGVFLDVNGKPLPRGYYNLVCSIRDVGLFCKGMSIHRHWRLRDVKLYFGLKGNKDRILEQLELINDYLNDDAQIKEDAERKIIEI